MAKIKEQEVEHRRGPKGKVDPKVFVQTLMDCGMDPDEAATKLKVDRGYVFSKVAALRQAGLTELQLKRKSRKSNTISELRQLLTGAAE